MADIVQFPAGEERPNTMVPNPLAELVEKWRQEAKRIGKPSEYDACADALEKVLAGQHIVLPDSICERLELAAIGGYLRAGEAQHLVAAMSIVAAMAMEKDISVHAILHRLDQSLHQQSGRRLACVSFAAHVTQDAQRLMQARLRAARPNGHRP